MGQLLPSSFFFFFFFFLIWGDCEKNRERELMWKLRLENHNICANNSFCNISSVISLQQFVSIQINFFLKNFKYPIKLLYLEFSSKLIVYKYIFFVTYFNCMYEIYYSSYLIILWRTTIILMSFN